MGRLALRIAVISAAVLAAAGALFAVSLPWLVSTEVVQSSIERELGNFFGTRAQIGGRTEVTVFPRPRVALRDVRIEAPGRDAGTILASESLEADIGLVGLIGGRPEFSNFRLVRPHLRLVRQADGRIDWLAQSGRVGRLFAAWGNDAAPGGSRPQHHQAGVGDRLGTMIAENGRLTIEGADGTIVEDITEIDATVNWPRLDAPLAVTADLIWRGAAGSVRFATQAPTAFFRNAPAETRFAIDSETVALDFNGRANVGGPPFADGTLTFATPSVRTFMTLLDADVTAGRALGAVELSGPVRLAQRRIRFEGLSMSIDGNGGKGVLEIGLNQPDTGPALTGTLDFQSLDIRAFLSAFVDVQGLIGTGAVETSRAASQMTADFRISAASATFGDLRLGDLAATAQVSEEVAIFDIGDAQAYGGHVQARLSLSPGIDGETAEVMLSGQNVDTAAIGEAYALPRALPRGRGNFSVTLSGPAAGPLRSTRDLAGTIAIEMAAGVMPGFSLDALFERKQIARYFSLDMDAAAQRFETARLYGDIAEGLLTLKETRITYPQGDVLLSGIVSLGSGSLAVTAMAARGHGAPDTPNGEADEERGAPEETAQFFVGGSWNRPFATPVVLP